MCVSSVPWWLTVSLETKRPHYTPLSPHYMHSTVPSNVLKFLLKLVKLQALFEKKMILQVQVAESWVMDREKSFSKVSKNQGKTLMLFLLPISCWNQSLWIHKDTQKRWPNKRVEWLDLWLSILFLKSEFISNCFWYFLSKKPQSLL